MLVYSMGYLKTFLIDVINNVSFYIAIQMACSNASLRFCIDHAFGRLI